MAESQHFASANVLSNPVQNEEWLQLALMAARMGTWEWQISSGDVYWSKNVEAIFGLPSGTFGRNYASYKNLILAEDLSRVEAALASALQGYTDDYEVVHRVRWADGSIHWVEGRGRVVRDGQGRPERMLGTVADVTQRMLAEQREKTFSNVVQHLELGLYVYQLENVDDDRSLKLVAANPAAERLTRIPTEHILGQQLDTIFPGLRARGITAALAEVARGGPARSYEDFVYGDDRLVSAIWSFRAFPLPENAVGVCFESITERKRSENRLIQAHKLEGIGRLAGGVAHDFNNLLTGILGYVEIIKMSLPPESHLQEAIREIFDAGERAKCLTHQLLTFARRQRTEPQVLNVNRLISDYLPLLQRATGERIGIALQLHDDPLQVKIDAGQFEQILINLSLHARDTMRHGGALTIQTRRVEMNGEGARDLARGEYVQLSFRDTGDGLDADILPHIFEPFFTAKGAGIGPGLALATVHGVVTQNGGLIDAQSAPGEGTVFRIHLPACRGESTPDVSARGRIPPAVAHGTETVLLVEDEEFVRSVAAQTLRAYGYTVLDAPDAESAMVTANQYGGNIHLLLTDVVMPRVSGAQLARRIQEQWPRVRVLFTSGYAENSIVHNGVLDKDIEFLPKPYTPSALARRVREVLDME